MRKFIRVSAVISVVAFGMCVMLVSVSDQTSTDAPTSSGGGQAATTMAEEWAATVRIPDGVRQGDFFGMAPTGDDIEWAWVETSRSNFQHHVITFPDGSKIDTGWVPSGGQTGLRMDYIVTLPLR